MKISLVGAELFYAAGQTDMMKLIVALHNFTDSPKNSAPVSKNKLISIVKTSEQIITVCA
jgi:hypothetical protein